MHCHMSKSAIGVIEKRLSERRDLNVSMDITTDSDSGHDPL